MKSLLIADLLIIIAFFALAKPDQSIKPDIPMTVYTDLTIEFGGFNTIPLNLYGQKRYISEEDSSRIALQFFDYCARLKECDAKLVAINNRLEIVPVE